MVKDIDNLTKVIRTLIKARKTKKCLLEINSFFETNIVFVLQKPYALNSLKVLKNDSLERYSSLILDEI